MISLTPIKHGVFLRAVNIYTVLILINTNTVTTRSGNCEKRLIFKNYNAFKIRIKKGRKRRRKLCTH